MRNILGIGYSLIIDYSRPMKTTHPITRYRLSLILAFTFSAVIGAGAQTRWSINDHGGITWNVQPDNAHEDHVEMSGEQVSVIVTYGVDASRKFTISRHVVFPMLRFEPNQTHDHLALVFGEDASPRLFMNGRAPRNEVTSAVHLKGILRAEGTMGRNREIAWTRSVFPSIDKPAVIEKVTLVNRSNGNVTIEVEGNERAIRTNPKRGIYGAYLANSQILGVGESVLEPGESLTYAVVITARKASEPSLQPDADVEEESREGRVGSFLSKLQLETPDPVLNTAFAFAKIRGAESIYRTQGGLMHGPGGGAYYAAIWANDQAEYANPFFAFLGDEIAIESAINSYRHFARFMNPEYRPIPSSIISEGVGFWHGARDRGDMAMIAYGATRFALALGGKEAAEELWPLIEWCLEYCHRKINDQGVVASDSDELENRFPSGNANLCTSSLYYDALNSAVMLGKELGKPAGLLSQYAERATAIRAAIELHFGARVEGFDTYRYYDKRDLVGNRRFANYVERPDVLRAWICIPLTVGIHERAEGTIAALFSPRLWTEDGLATEAGQETFWDRSTLYALRGVFAAGATRKGLDYLTYYSNRRLLGDHVPYPVEAYPEGNQRHLSAESSLYCRIYTEGLFGMRPTGFRSFNCTPRLPMDWNEMKLRKIHAFGSVFDVEVGRAGDQLQIRVLVNGNVVSTRSISEGETAAINLPQG